MEDGGRGLAVVFAAVHGRLSPPAEHLVSLAPVAAGGGRVLVLVRRRPRSLPLDEYVADHFARLRVHFQHVTGSARRGRWKCRRRGRPAVAHVHRVGKNHPLGRGDGRDGTACRHRHRRRGRLVFRRRVHAGLLYGTVQQPRAVRFQVQSQVERVVVVQWVGVGQRQRGGVRRSIHRELFDHHVPARVRRRRGDRTVARRPPVVVGGRPRGAAVARVVSRLVRRQRLCCAPAELTVPLSFYLVISFLLFLVLVQVVQHVMQHQIVTVFVFSLQTRWSQSTQFIVYV